MKGILCAAALVVACGGDDTTADMTGDGGIGSGSGSGSGSSDAGTNPGAGEPANLTGITAAHNMVRAMVNTTGISGGPLPPMTWDPDLAAHALAYAEMCIDTQAPSGLIDHSPSSYRQNKVGYSYIGENVYGSGGSATASGAVTTWANEKNNFTYPNGCSGVCGHYTQIVWRTSVNLGCANVTCNGLQYGGTILCMYGPGGNNGGAPY